MCDESVVRLQGELEGLRAQKAVLLCFSEQQPSVEVPSVLSSIAPLDSTRIGRLKHKLRLQKKQTNVLRVKLGAFLAALLSV